MGAYLSSLKVIVIATALVAAAFTSALATTQSVLGRVVAIADGDTLTLLTPNHTTIKVRLAEVDAPEKGQPWGRNSKAMLSELAFGKQARAQVTDLDRYGRSVARIYVGSTDVNLEMVRRGGAWAYERYLTDPMFRDAEASARRSKRGLWAMPPEQIVPPWQWRANKRAGSAQPSTQSPVRFLSSTPASNVSCGAKRYCKQMASCAEAKTYLHQCGVSSLDGDGDGVPCDNLCRGR